jgi:NAD(P)-dependent dehydrogenase (short-subunit alcohol dehydrogenase family)
MKMKTVVVTGATSGIGLATAMELASLGYRVLCVGHTQAGCDAARTQLDSRHPGNAAEFFHADLLQQREVHRVADELAAAIRKNGGELYALVSNAGCVRNWYATTEEGYEQQFALNHLAGFILSERLLPFLEESRGRVIITGSASHKHMRVHWDDVMFSRRYHPLLAYKQSKLCNLLLAFELNRRYADRGIHAYAVDPGLVRTDIGNKQVGGLTDWVWSLRKKHGVEASVPAKTFAWLCEQESAPTGLYYGLCRPKKHSRQVNADNAGRLWELSKRLCGKGAGEAL